MTPPLGHRVQAAALAASALCIAAASALAADDVTALLRDADRFRAGADNLQVDTQISVFNRDGSLDKERRYTVFAQADRKSLVLMRSPAEAGQKVLMLGDDFWLLLPSSARPLRITPAQKLLGDASTGDIATLRWADDYQGRIVGDENCDGTPCRHLSLAAARKGLSYARIELWLGARRHEPISAELYVQSDKLAKLARFVIEGSGAQAVVGEMVLRDQLGNHKETRVRYLSRQARQVPEAWLNPMFLARSPALE